MAATQLKNLSAHHYSLVDFIIQNSHEKGWRDKACAAFGFSKAYLSIITKSDVFREEFQSRLSAWRSEATHELQAMQFAVAKRAYARLLDVLASDGVEDELVLDIANSTMKLLGFGPSSGAGPNITRETEYTRTEEREVAPGVLEQARVTYRKVTSEQLPAAVSE